MCDKIIGTTSSSKYQSNLDERLRNFPGRASLQTWTPMRWVIFRNGISDFINTKANFSSASGFLTGSLHGWQFPSLLMQVMFVLATDSNNEILPIDCEINGFENKFPNTSVKEICIRALASVLELQQMCVREKIFKEDLQCMDLLIRNYRLNQLKLHVIKKDLSMNVKIKKNNKKAGRVSYEEIDDADKLSADNDSDELSADNDSDEPLVNGDEPLVNGDEPLVNGDEPLVNGDEPLDEKLKYYFTNEIKGHYIGHRPFGITEFGSESIAFDTQALERYMGPSLKSLWVR
jgi:hypothetical protein